MIYAKILCKYHMSVSKKFYKVIIKSNMFPLIFYNFYIKYFAIVSVIVFFEIFIFSNNFHIDCQLSNK